MQITVKKCLSLPIFSSATVVAGADGLNHTVDSITTAEIFPENNEIFNKFVRPNELTISAFASIHDNLKIQQQVVRRSAASKGAGLILCYVGFYLKEISQDLINIANELNYPIIIIPSTTEIAYVDIIRSVMELVMKEKFIDKTFYGTAQDYVTAVINNNSIQADIIAKSLGINTDNLHGICTFSNLSQLQSKEYLEAISQQFTQMLNEISIQTITSIIDGRFVLLLFSDYKKNYIYELFQKTLHSFIAGIDSNDILVYANFNKYTMPFHKLYADFCSAEKYLTLIFPNKSIFNTFAVQFTISCLDIIRDNQNFFNEDSLYRFFDNLGDEDLIKTLSIYILDSNMNSSVAAKILFVHTNTILYRIHKIKEALPLTLTDISELNSLSTALAIRRILKGS